MSTQFDSHADSYRDEVDRAIAFAGQDVEFFAERKAELLARAARRLLGDPAELSVLDVGCGIGLVDGYLTPRFRSVAGTDVSAAELEVAQATHSQVSYTLSEPQRVPYESDTFDVVFAACVLHHLNEGAHDGFVAELARVVRPGGLAVVFEHNPLNPLTRLVVSRVAFDTGVRLLRSSTVAALFESAGFEQVRSVYTTFLPLRGRLAQRIEVRLAPLPIGAQYAVLGRKAGS